MPAPAAPTAVTLTQTTSGQGFATLAWSHVVTGLDRFLIAYKLSGDTYWTSHTLATATDLGGAGSYSTVVPIQTSIVYAVWAANTSNELSAGKL